MSVLERGYKLEDKVKRRGFLILAVISIAIASTIFIEAFLEGELKQIVPIWGHEGYTMAWGMLFVGGVFIYKYIKSK